MLEYFADFFRQLWRGIRGAWKELSLSARINILLAAIAVVVVIGVVVITAPREQYVTLSSNLDGAQASQIVQLLTDNGIPYQQQDTFNTVLVPASQRDRAFLLLEENELPVGRKIPAGFETFSETDLMTNRWLQDMKFMQAVKGELEKQLSSFSFVEYANVLIREAPEELFKSDQLPSEASVVLKVTRPLTDLEKKTIVSMIARAGGSNLHEGNITVTTTDLEPIWLPANSEFAALATDRLEFQDELESRAEKRIRNRLNELGIRGTVSVAAKLDHTKTETTSTEVTEGEPLSTYEMSTTTSSEENLPEGAPGAFANVAEQAPAPGALSNKEEITETIQNLENSNTVTRTQTEPGDVVKYTVALVVQGDEYEVTAGTDGAETRTYVGMSDKLRQTCESIAMSAVGEGKEKTEVSLHDFEYDAAGISASVAAVEAAESANMREWYMQIGWQAAQVLMIILLFYLVRNFLRRAIEEPKEERIEQEVGEIPEATLEDMRRQEIAQEIMQLAMDEPDTVAALLRSWMIMEEE
ncbi:MAG: flagellar M-ring protein FliF [Candidatus Hydrogenedentes bacterium]|nr:flagellar M-ring protein FliF [Candidatus Hydrogenedentota bacterium]